MAATTFSSTSGTARSLTTKYLFLSVVFGILRFLFRYELYLAAAVGISRSSFYKYKDDIFPFHEEAKGKTITFIIQMDDEPGILSNVLRAIAQNHGNILTIHQSIPISGIATLTLSVQILQGEGDAEAMVDDIEQMEGIHYLKILGRE